MADKKLDNIKRINRLWEEIYPFLASAIMEDFDRQSGRVLEIGPFSGGLSMELARSYPKLEITIATWKSEVIKYLKKEVADEGLVERIKLIETDDGVFDFSNSYFDLIICRGALFFLNKKLLLESFRILAKNGLAFIGGGYGRSTPQNIIDAIHDESHVLNQSLGKRWITKSNLEELVRETALTDNCHIEEEGGLWLIIKK